MVDLGTVRNAYSPPVHVFHFRAVFHLPPCSGVGVPLWSDDTADCYMFSLLLEVESHSVSIQRENKLLNDFLNFQLCQRMGRFEALETHLIVTDFLRY